MDKKPRLLIIEDNKGDILLLKHALAEIGFEYDYEVISDGLSVMGEVPIIPKERCPDLILLDLNLPRCSGWDILKVIEKQCCLKRACVIILSTSDAPSDMEKAAEYDVTYLKKPIDYISYIDIARRIVDHHLDR